MDINQKGFANMALIVLVIVLTGALGYVTLIKKPVSSLIPTTSESTSPVTSKKYTISPKTIPIVFELPKGYAIFQREGFEGGYSTTISVGKEVSSGHFNYAPLGIDFFATVYDTQLQREYSSMEYMEYVDVVFNEQKKNPASSPQYIELFGNKAVKYTNDVDSSITIVGYLRTDVLSKLSQSNGYLVRISSGTYGSGVRIDKELFDTVVNSLRVSK